MTIALQRVSSKAVAQLHRVMIPFRVMVLYGKGVILFQVLLRSNFVNRQSQKLIFDLVVLNRFSNSFCIKLNDFFLQNSQP